MGCLGVDGGRAEAVDTRVPVEIVESEELERVSSLLQRDNLVRGLGIVEHVYRLLHCTPGTMGVQLRTDRHHTVSRLHARGDGSPTEGRQAPHGEQAARPGRWASN